MPSHAILSPSAAHRWMNCPGSVAMESGLPDIGSNYADEGTAAHFLAAECLTHRTDPVRYLRQTIMVAEDGRVAFSPTGWEPMPVASGFEIDEEMVQAVRKYVDAVRVAAEGHELSIEVALPIGQVTTEDGATGTADAMILTASGAELQVRDLKYGRGIAVEAKDNEQLMLYAAGALELADMLGVYPERVVIAIHQPRLSDTPSEHILQVDELRKFMSHATERGRHALAVLRNEDPKAYHHHLRPSADTCRWCKAKANCPAVRDVVAEACEIALPEPGVEIPPTTLALVEDWLKAARADIEARLIKGDRLTLWKLVQGRQGAREWSDPNAAEALLKSFRLKQDQMYAFKLISPTATEKLLKEESPKRWAKCQPLITRKEGSLSVAPMDDPRPAFVPSADTLDEFDALELV